jgi:hypothetical protein
VHTRYTSHKMKHKRNWFGIAAGLLLLCATVFGAGGFGGGVQAQNLTQGYLTDQKLQNGMIIRLVPKDTSKVEALKKGEIADMLGVIVSSTDAPLSVSDPTKRQVFVATYGKYDVLVSNENDVIKPGDFVTISSVDGVGMRSDGNYQLILGKALLGFAGTNDAESHLTLTDSNGGKRNVALRRIPVEISVAHNPVYTGDSIVGVPRFLSNVARAVTSKPITAVRIYACVAVLFLSLVVAGGVMYSGVRTGMNSIGRNPLAKKSITRNLITVILMGLIVVAIGLIAVYLLLRI